MKPGIRTERSRVGGYNSSQELGSALADSSVADRMTHICNHWSWASGRPTVRRHHPWSSAQLWHLIAVALEKAACQLGGPALHLAWTGRRLVPSQMGTHRARGLGSAPFRTMVLCDRTV